MGSAVTESVWSWEGSRKREQLTNFAGELLGEKARHLEGGMLDGDGVALSSTVDEANELSLIHVLEALKSLTVLGHGLGRLVEFAFWVRKIYSAGARRGELDRRCHVSIIGVFEYLMRRTLFTRGVGNHQYNISQRSLLKSIPLETNNHHHNGVFRARRHVLEIIPLPPRFQHLHPRSRSVRLPSALQGSPDPTTF